MSNTIAMQLVNAAAVDWRTLISRLNATEWDSAEDELSDLAVVSSFLTVYMWSLREGKSHKDALQQARDALRKVLVALEWEEPETCWLLVGDPLRTIAQQLAQKEDHNV